jgi:hypothetical protein
MLHLRLHVAVTSKRVYVRKNKWELLRVIDSNGVEGLLRSVNMDMRIGASFVLTVTCIVQRRHDYCSCIIPSLGNPIFPRYRAHRQTFLLFLPRNSHGLRARPPSASILAQLAVAFSLLTLSVEV